ncbi:MAG: DNA repair protein RecN [Alphaproteobacteria bacterium]|nr:DNA repair protein RecN [Alphaproteobacteria bacterium]MCB9928912.1 DNA repair protein RecN [Alphaproteobacteria bacterium]
MLRQLAIKRIALIDDLTLDFADGLGVLTGETGAGKSILLDSLGLVLGARADAGLVQAGADRAIVTAVFGDRALALVEPLLAETGVELEPGEDRLVLRRVLSAEGRSRAFVNDQPVSAGLLRRIGERLVEVQGQFDSGGLTDPAGHRDLLDAFGGLEAESGAVAAAWRDWQAQVKAWQDQQAALAASHGDADWLRHALEELDKLGPEADEASKLAEERRFLQAQERILEAIQGARGAVSGKTDVANALRAAMRALERSADKVGDRFDPALQALDRAAIEFDEALNAIDELAHGVDLDGSRLDAVETRLFALRDLARKHRCEPDQLAAVQAQLAANLEALERADQALAEAEQAAAAARAAFEARAAALSDARREAAGRLDAAVAGELAPLRLEKAAFRTDIEDLAPEQWSTHGRDRVRFAVRTNPGMPFGPIERIASGGERARFLLALKVVLAAADPVGTLVFDEVDAGIGGATAAAVGERLARLGEEVQVLVVTHSPQVAARGRHHLHVRKAEQDGRSRTQVDRLADSDRHEEIARMLAGETVTEEARAAALRLLHPGRRGTAA